jgi:hypothetical protein
MGMTVTYIEKSISLGKMEPGQMACSKDRKSIFACGWSVVKPEGSKDIEMKKVILKLNDLSSQYPDKWNMDQPVILISSANAMALQFTESM